MQTDGVWRWSAERNVISGSGYMITLFVDVDVVEVADSKRGIAKETGGECKAKVSKEIISTRSAFVDR